MDLAFAPFKVDVNPTPAKIFGQLRHCVQPLPPVLSVPQVLLQA